MVLSSLGKFNAAPFAACSLKRTHRRIPRREIRRRAQPHGAPRANCALGTVTKDFYYKRRRSAREEVLSASLYPSDFSFGAIFFFFFSKVSTPRNFYKITVRRVCVCMYT